MNHDDFIQQLDAVSERVLSKALTVEDATNYSESLFESIRHVNEYGEEFWYARELQTALEYTEWRNFKKVIDKAILACESSDNLASDHFVDVIRYTLRITHRANNVAAGKSVNLPVFARPRIGAFTAQTSCESKCQSSLSK